MSETVTQVNETTQQIVRSRTCGLKDFYIALVQSNTATAYTAGTPVKLARAIKAKIDEKWTSEKIYSDDNTEEVITSYEGTDVELEINALAPQDRVILFGQLYEKGFLRKNSLFGSDGINFWIICIIFYFFWVMDCILYARSLCSTCNFLFGLLWIIINY